MDMSLYEYQDLLISTQSLLVSQFTFVISLLSGYLAIAYFAGKKLTRFQMLTVSGVYVVVTFFASMALIGIAGQQVSLRVDMYTAYGVGTMQEVNPIPQISLGAILLVCIIASLLFMRHSRRQ